MNKTIEKLLKEREFNKILNLVELGIIDKEIGTKAIISTKKPEYIYRFAASIEGADIDKL